MMASVILRRDIPSLSFRAIAVELWQAGVNGIITDDPGLMVKTRSGMRPSR